MRRRGRWVTTKVMELYLQEVLYTTYTERISETARNKIQNLAGVFPKVLEKTICFLKGAIPPQVWFRLFQADDNEELGREGTRWKFSPAFSTTNCGAGAGPRSKAVKSFRSAECLYSDPRFAKHLELLASLGPSGSQECSRLLWTVSIPIATCAEAGGSKKTCLKVVFEESLDVQMPGHAGLNGSGK